MKELHLPFSRFDREGIQFLKIFANEIDHQEQYQLLYTFAKQCQIFHQIHFAHLNLEDVAQKKEDEAQISAGEVASH